MDMLALVVWWLGVTEVVVGVLVDAGGVKSNDEKEVSPRQSGLRWPPSRSAVCSEAWPVTAAEVLLSKAEVLVIVMRRWFVDSEARLWESSVFCASWTIDCVTRKHANTAMFMISRRRVAWPVIAVQWRG